jgi:chemotaxis family two-component system response regulator Rcp1
MPTDTIEILLVEDNPADIRLAKETLKITRCRTSCRSCRTEKRRWLIFAAKGEYANASLPDMVLLDVALPEGGWRGRAARIRADDRLRHLPVVVMTASKLDERMMHSLGVRRTAAF